jgi:hypothetical protein
LKSKKLTKKFILVAKISIFEQFLTLENVPIIFDKCIRYINAFGLTKEGVYRINGQKKNYTVLVEQS